MSQSRGDRKLKAVGMGRRGCSGGWSELDDAMGVDSLVALLVRLGDLPWTELLITTVLMLSALLLSTMFSCATEPKSLSSINDTVAMHWSALSHPMTAASRPITSAWGLVHGKGM
mmetsp:Transcript_1515/g.3834  ORF Transcript_1515/g.3834 Transcript_1515/m.3834 type:complete len:115 (+) Transcript_1515:243-587(+)|eukprot:CAMPEP_0173424954 /NCGR_PEP_ID=MMETSP1357-20121228/4765_1 /TAXON_ID=77926 /ORGANISM="Hemiselmis rufescens, Strain PCC563" /LENGTH=114 /DNA_ID=CAMNT_0014388295 /DNA_START=149 /DNA_END=493 /DNA_ORIENTATION=-